MKKAKKYISHHCPNCYLPVRSSGITFCVCSNGYWKNAKWVTGYTKKRG